MEIELPSSWESDVLQNGGESREDLEVWTQTCQQTRDCLEATTDEVTALPARMPNTTTITILCRLAGATWRHGRPPGISEGSALLTFQRPANTLFARHWRHWH